MSLTGGHGGGRSKTIEDDQGRSRTAKAQGPKPISQSSALRAVRKAAFGLFGTLAPGPAATWFENFILTPSRYRSNGAEASFTNGEPLRIPYGHGWLSAWSWGKGPVVMLMHGWSGRAVHLDAFVQPLVDAGFRVVAFDAPAHGQSDGVMTNIIDCTGAALQVARTAGQIHGIIAHSFGAPTAAYAVQHGLEVHRMVLIGAPVSFGNLTHRIATMMGFPPNVSELMQRRLENRLGISWNELDTDKMLADAAIPLLVFHDEDDHEVPYENGVAIVSAIENARLVTSSGLGHRRIVRDPAVVRQAVEFLSRE